MPNTIFIFWVTNIYEEEWGSDAAAQYSELIPEDNIFKNFDDSIQWVKNNI